MRACGNPFVAGESSPRGYAGGWLLPDFCKFVLAKNSGPTWRHHAGSEACFSLQINHLAFEVGEIAIRPIGCGDGLVGIGIGCRKRLLCACIGLGLGRGQRRIDLADISGVSRPHTGRHVGDLALVGSRTDRHCVGDIRHPFSRFLTDHTMSHHECWARPERPFLSSSFLRRQDKRKARRTLEERPRKGERSE
jgi:hypothetical protein